MTYEVLKTQEINVVKGDAQNIILAVQVSYSEGDFLSETTFEFPGTVTDAEVEQKIIDYGTELKLQINERNFTKTGTI